MGVFKIKRNRRNGEQSERRDSKRSEWYEVYFKKWRDEEAKECEKENWDKVKEKEIKSETTWEERRGSKCVEKNLCRLNLKSKYLNKITVDIWLPTFT